MGAENQEEVEDLSQRREVTRILVGGSIGAVAIMVGLFLLILTYYEIALNHQPVLLSWWLPVVAILMFILGFLSLRWGFRKINVQRS